MASSWGNFLKVQIFGESHGPAIGVVVDGLPPGESIDMAELQAFLDRRAPGRGAFSTARREGDMPQFLSGILNGRTTGAPLCAIIRNNDTKSADYAALKDIPRPGHADFTAALRYNGAQDSRGGGHFSGRLTAPLCIAGGIARQILARRGIFTGAHLASVGVVDDSSFDAASLTREQMLAPGMRSFPVIDEKAGEAMRAEIEMARLAGDSIGGCIEAAVLGVPAGYGSPMFDGVENRLASIIFGIPAIRGVEFGCGFAAARLRGSQHNDPYAVDSAGRIRTASNNHGGILGGITSGMPIIVRAAVKPTPSIAMEQDSVNMATGESVKISVPGRHDPCIAPRAVPVIEAACAIAILDLAQSLTH